MKKLTLIVITILSVSACKSLDQIKQTLRELNPLGSKVEFVLPAKSQELVAFEEISLEAENNSLQLAHNVKNILSNLQVQNQSYFSAVSLNQTSTNSALIAEVALVGVSDELAYSRETRIKCPGKKLINTCKSDEGYKYQVSCQARIVNVSGNINASANGRAVLQSYQSISTKEKVCNDESSGLPSLQSQIDNSVARLANILIADYIPSTEKRPSDLVEPQMDANPQMEIRFEQAADLLHDNKISQSIQVFEELHSKYPNNQALTFNLGYAYQAYGEFKRADALYAKVKSLELQDEIQKYRSETVAYLDNNITTSAR